MLNQKMTAYSATQRISILVIASIILLYFVFGPAVYLQYFGGDDFRYAFGGIKKPCRLDDGFEYMITLGRPIQAYMDCGVFKFAHTYERMMVIRFLAVVLIGCVMGLLADWFYRLKFPLYTAFLAAASIVIVPHLSYDSILTASLSLPAALLFVLIGYHCINKSYTVDKTARLAWVSLSAVSILCAMLTYPASSFFFGVLVLSKLLFSNLADWLKSRREIFQEVGLFCGVSIVYFLWAYYNMHYHALTPISSDHYQLDHPNLNLTEMFHRLAALSSIVISFWVHRAFDLHLAWVALLIAIIILVGLGKDFFYFMRENRYSLQSVLPMLCQFILGVLALWVFCCGFELILPNMDLGSRLLMGAVGASFVLVYWLVIRFASIFPETLKNIVTASVFIIIFMSSGLEVNQMLTTEAQNHQKVINSLKENIQSYLEKGNTLHRIHFIVPKEVYPYNQFFLANGALMKILAPNSYDIQWCSLSRGTPGSEQDHQKEALACLNNLPKNGIGITYTYPGESYLKTDKMLEIQA